MLGLVLQLPIDAFVGFGLLVKTCEGFEGETSKDAIQSYEKLKVRVRELMHEELKLFVKFFVLVLSNSSF